MTSFQLSVTPPRRAAARYVAKVHRTLQKAFAECPDVSQSAIADALGVHRSVINRQLRGYKDMSLGRVAELAWAMGFEADFALVRPVAPQGCNTPMMSDAANPFQVGQTSSTNRISNAPKGDLELVL